MNKITNISNIFNFFIQRNVNVKIDKSTIPLKLDTAQKKLLIVFCYYVVLTVIALTSFTLATRNTGVIVNSAKRYFLCEQNGHDPSEPCSRSELERLMNPTGITLSFILAMALFPVVNLVYIVNIQELKELWRKCLVKMSSFSFFNLSSQSTTPTTSTLRESNKS